MRKRKILTLSILIVLLSALSLYFPPYTLIEFPTVKAEALSPWLIDYCTVTSSFYNIYAVHPSSTTAYSGASQCWTPGVNCYLNSTKVYLAKTGSPDAILQIAIADMSGTFGSSGVPTGAALLTSDELATTDIASSGYYQFNFSGSPLFTAGSNYTLYLFVASGTINIDNRISIYYDSTNSHSGNAAAYYSSAWQVKTVDINFELYGVSENSYYVTSSIDSGGSISQSGTYGYNEGEDVYINWSANAGKTIDAVAIDAAPYNLTERYVFYNIAANHTIEVDTVTESEFTAAEYIGSNDGSYNINTAHPSADSGKSAQGEACSIDISGWLYKVAFRISPAGNTEGSYYYAALYNLSGTYGVNAVPTGAPLEVSALEAVYGSGAQFYYFYFSKNTKILYGETYAVTLNKFNGTGSLAVYLDNTAPSYGGNGVTYSSSAWSADSGFDSNFMLITAAQAGYYVTASINTGKRCAISNEGAKLWTTGDNAYYNYSAKTGWNITEVLVDAAPVAITGSYTFTSISDTHTIAITADVPDGYVLVDEMDNFGNEYSGDFSDAPFQEWFYFSSTPSSAVKAAFYQTFTVSETCWLSNMSVTLIGFNGGTSPDCRIRAGLWNITGTYGYDATPSGNQYAPLALSTNTVEFIDLEEGEYTDVWFSFDGLLCLESGKQYCAVFFADTQPTSFAAHWADWAEESEGKHAGNGGSYAVGSGWDAERGGLHNGTDLAFTVLGMEYNSPPEQTPGVAIEYYFRADAYETNGVTAYGLDADFTNDYINVTVPTTPCYLGFRVWKVSQTGAASELTFGVPEGIFYFNGSLIYDDFSSSWNCPGTTLNLGYDCLKVSLYAMTDNVSWVDMADFVTPVLISKELEESTWYYTLVVDNGSIVVSFGDTAHRSGISGVSFSTPLESEIQLWRITTLDFLGFVLGAYIDVIGEAFYVLVLLLFAGLLYFRYRNFGVIVFFFALFGTMGGLLWFFIPAWAAAVACALIILGTTFLVWRLIR